MKLTEFPKKSRYSILESYMFDLMPKNGKKVSSRMLAEGRAEMGKWKVGNPLNTVTVTMNKLIDKVKANKEEFVIKKDDKRPAHPEVEYWVERR
jgi:hypothetical protein